jgi:predicted metal-binding membrane protein
MAGWLEPWTLLRGLLPVVNADFAVSIGSLLWMTALAVVMGVEKNLPWGRSTRYRSASCS